MIKDGIAIKRISQHFGVVISTVYRIKNGKLLPSNKNIEGEK
jgi:hypothetical protein